MDLHLKTDESFLRSQEDLLQCASLKMNFTCEYG